MPYVERDGEGAVKGVYGPLQPGIAEEFLADDHPDVVAYLNPPVRRLIPKSTILARLTDPQLEAAIGAMTVRQQERWRAPDKPKVYIDDPELLAVLSAVGADPETVLAE